MCPLDGARLEEAPDPLVGRTIGGRYLICELIGTGGMGAVYRGRHQLVGRDVALKFLAPRYASDPAARERFLREARAANRIDHEHIIDITDFGETSDKLVFLVMEYLEGEPLSKIIEQGALEPRRALNIAWQLATALARAHELDVIHRDIKPDNIFVLQRRGGDFVKLLDFGLAKVVGEHRLTAAGKVFGTPEYLAPEQARGDTLTGHADQYALGCVLYEMLTSVLPFDGPSPEVVIKHLHAAPEPPSKKRPELGKEFDALCLRLLAKNPHERFADAYHLADELRALLERGQGGRSSKPPRRSGVLSVPAPEATATQPWVDAAEEAWALRYELFKSLVPRAFGNAEPPEAVRRGLCEMSEQVEHARSVRKQLSDNLLRAKEHEDNLRAARLRVGHAADELGQDESRVSRRIADTRAAIQEVERRLAELEQPLREGKQQLAQRAVLDRNTVELIRQLGGAATLWLETEAQLAQLSSRVVAGEREREDLRFQIAQLKGRLGILNAEADGERNALRAQAEALESELQRVVDTLARSAEPISRALLEIPGMREALSQARGGAPARSAAPRA
ncbi:MAG TPA: protein kinase [Polyangiales bacterium]